MAGQELEPSVDELVEQLRARVAERRQRGEYPPHLEEQLDQHFDRIASHLSPAYDLAELRRRLVRLGSVATFSPGRISYSTRLPAGRLLHRLVAKIVGRQTAGILAQLQEHSDALSSFAEEVTAAFEHPRLHTHDELRSQIDLLFDRLSAYERAVTGAPALAAMVPRIEALEAERERWQFSASFSNEAFEAAFRGGREEIQERYRDLARRFADADGPVVDIGCGRGEFVELLVELGVDAMGIDIDPDLVALAQERSLPVEYGSLVPWLERQDDGALAGLSLIQVVEHVSSQELVEFVELSRRKVKPGGKVVVETVNPQSLYVFAHSFYLDPTHVAPVHPAYLMFLFEQSGYQHVEIDWRSPCPPDDVLQEPAGDSPLEKTIATNVERLNRLLFAAQDYAIVATR
jgi:O-antigen chain-terminating methyltransferase